MPIWLLLIVAIVVLLVGPPKSLSGNEVLGAWIVPAIMAGSSILGGLLAGRASKAKGGPVPQYTPSPEEQGSQDYARLLMEGMRQGQNTMLGSIGMPSMEAVQNFWMPILQGDRNAISNLLAPEMELISRQYDVARRSAEGAIPRGGGRDVALTQMRGQQASDIGSLIGRARPAAAQGLLQLSGLAVPAGIEMGQTAGAQNLGLLNTLLGQRQVSVQAQYPHIAAQQGAYSMGAGVGRGIWDILNTVWPQNQGANASGSTGFLEPSEYDRRTAGAYAKFGLGRR